MAMKTNSFKPITNPFLKNIEFVSPNTPGLFFNSQSGVLNIFNNIKSRKAEGTPLYLVDLQSTLTSMIDDMIIFDIRITYSIMVEIAEENMSEDDIKQILNVEVPECMYDYVRVCVWEIIKKADLSPFMMGDFDSTIRNAPTTSFFEDDKLDSTLFDEDNGNVFPFLEKQKGFDYESMNDDSSRSPCRLSWKWILEDIQSEESGVLFLKTIKDKTGHDLLVYEETPLFKWFFRFLIPIEYNHPDYKECASDYWPLLFQLLFAEGENVKVIDGENGLPEIEFEYSDEERRTVSSLTLEELRLCTSMLSIRVITCTLIDIIKYEKQIDVDYANRLKDDQLILKEEFHALYKTDQPDASAEDIEFVEKMYARIKECDLQTFRYKF